MKYEDLFDLVNQVRGSSFMGLTTETKVKLKGGKKNPMQGRVTKVTENSNVMIFSNCAKSGYEEMVKRRMKEEGKNPNDFTLKPRTWGKRIEDTPFIEHNGKKYLECIFITPGKSKYLLDGKEIDKEDIEGMPEESENRGSSAQGGIENQVIIRTYAIDSIRYLKLKGKEVT
jgi:hypothetical protein